MMSIGSRKNAGLRSLAAASLVLALLVATFSCAAAQSQAPVPPSDLELLAASDLSITISWDASPGATSYNIYRATSSGLDEYAPEVMVLMPCSLALERVADELDTRRTLPSWETLPAVRSRRVYAGDTHLFSRSGPRLVDGVKVLARMLHPEVFEQRLAVGHALKLSADGQRLEQFR